MDDSVAKNVDGYRELFKTLRNAAAVRRAVRSIDQEGTLEDEWRLLVWCRAHLIEERRNARHFVRAKYGVDLLRRRKRIKQPSKLPKTVYEHDEYLWAERRFLHFDLLWGCVCQAWNIAIEKNLLLIDAIRLWWRAYDEGMQAVPFITAIGITTARLDEQRSDSVLAFSGFVAANAKLSGENANTRLAKEAAHYGETSDKGLLVSLPSAVYQAWVEACQEGQPLQAAKKALSILSHEAYKSKETPFVEARTEKAPDDLEAFENAEMIRAVLRDANLADGERDVLMLRYYSELPYKDIAKLKGIAVGTVGATLSRAHHKVKMAYEQQEKQSA